MFYSWIIDKKALRRIVESFIIVTENKQSLPSLCFFMSRVNFAMIPFFNPKSWVKLFYNPNLKGIVQPELNFHPFFYSLR